MFCFSGEAKSEWNGLYCDGGLAAKIPALQLCRTFLIHANQGHCSLRTPRSESTGGVITRSMYS